MIPTYVFVVCMVAVVAWGVLMALASYWMGRRHGAEVALDEVAAENEQTTVVVRHPKERRKR